MLQCNQSESKYLKKRFIFFLFSQYFNNHTSSSHIADVSKGNKKCPHYRAKSRGGDWHGTKKKSREMLDHNFTAHRELFWMGKEKFTRNIWMKEKQLEKW